MPPSERVLRLVERELTGARVEVGPREARWIVEAALRANPGDPAPVALCAARRRAAGEPLQYVLGTAAFRHLELEVGPGVLVPRPETEVVAGRVLELAPPGGTVVDVGTGSGAIALALKQERPDLRVLATDDSPEALSWARRNRDRLGLEVELVAGDLLEGLPVGLRGAVDVVVSNPPYVAEDERGSLPIDVVDHEPAHALFAGSDGLEVIRRLCPAARDWLRPGGHLVLEIAPHRQAGVRVLMEAAGYRGIRIHPDLTGRPRVAEGRRA